MPDSIPFRAAPLTPHEVPEALAFAQRFGVLGVYVCNGLSSVSVEDRSLGGDPETREIMLLHGAEGLVGLVYFGGRGNLVVLCEQTLSSPSVAKTLFDGPEWRIALGPEGPLAQVARRDMTAPIVFREQLYYSIDDPERCRELATGFTPRPAVRGDADALVRAALDLNQSDLRVAPWRVNRAWLRDSVRERIEGDKTWVVGPVGKPDAKLDLGSVGSAGTMIEGVYTMPDRRGQGLGARLVAAVAQRELATVSPLVCLHVDARNAAARRAYGKAGMAVVASGYLLLRG